MTGVRNATGNGRSAKGSCCITAVIEYMRLIGTQYSQPHLFIGKLNALLARVRHATHVGILEAAILGRFDGRKACARLVS
jgi:transposase